MHADPIFSCFPRISLHAHMWTGNFGTKPAILGTKTLPQGASNYEHLHQLYLRITDGPLVIQGYMIASIMPVQTIGCSARPCCLASNKAPAL